MDLVVLKMTYTDALGNIYPDSAWLPAQINIGVADTNAKIVWYGYKNKDAALTVHIPGAEKVYALSGSVFLQYMAAQLAENPPPFIPQLFSHALNTLDTPDDQHVLKSFFDGAVQA